MNPLNYASLEASKRLVEAEIRPVDESGKVHFCQLVASFLKEIKDEQI